MVQTKYFSKIMTDKEIDSREGEYFDQSHYHTIINTDSDGYSPDGKLLFKFRKNVIPPELSKMALESWRKAAKKTHENRGASSGPLDRGKLPAYIGKFLDPGKFRTHFVSAHSGNHSKQYVSNLSPSNIIGYFDKPDRNLKTGAPPCRLTAFNADQPELWEQSVPFIEHVDQIFKNIVPTLHKKQRQRAAQTPQFCIGNTCFSTVTINYSWRTALHKDKGDYTDGFGNLMVLEDDENPNTYKGCYFGFPQYGICIDIRQGDFCGMDVHQWHCNTEFIQPTMSGGGKKEKLAMEKRNGWDFNRLSVVLYLRENMVRCKGLRIPNKHAGILAKSLSPAYIKSLPAGFLKFLKQKGYYV